MDKYEFNIKVEQIKKMVARSDYETAMKIADTIDWRRVRNINILSMAASIYEKNEEYQEAKDILLLAFERAPIGKRLLYKLAELAIKEGSLQEAEDYYREFCDLAPEDPRQYILRYLILGAKGAPVEQLIHTLEQYCNLELDEKWLYELAELYSEAGLDEFCIMTCDKIMLMFGLGKYVDKAMELKIQLAPLTKYQMDLVENRDKYEAKLKAVEQEYRMGGPVEYEDEVPRTEPEPYGYQDSRQESFSNVYDEAAYTREPEEEVEEAAYESGYRSGAQDEYEDDYQNEYQEGYDDGEEIPQSQLTIEPEETEELEEMEEPEFSQWAESDPIQDPEVSEEALKARIHEAEVQASLAMEMSRLSADDGFRQELEMAQTRVLTDIRDINRGEAVPASRHLMIEAETPELGLKEAVEALKLIHKETGAKNQAAKITGEKLNLKGVFSVADKLAGKDLIIEQAGVMTEGTLQELNQLIARDETGMNVVLIDTAHRLKELYRVYPGFAKQFEHTRAQVPLQIEPEKDERPVRHIEVPRENAGSPIPQPAAQRLRPKSKAVSEPQPIPKVASKPVLEQVPQPRVALSPEPQPRPTAVLQPESGVAPKPVPQMKPQPVPSRLNEAGSSAKGEAVRKKQMDKLPPSEIPSEPEYEDPTEEMDIDEFAKYACQYAGEIDCSISGKSMLALYERIEIMEEDGIPLTEDNAEDLIEEAADRAENPSFFKRLTGVFSSKYDREGLLILKEEHFI